MTTTPVKIIFEVESIKDLEAKRIIDEKSGNVNKKPTINQLRKENGLSEIPDGDIAFTKV